MHIKRSFSVFKELSEIGEMVSCDVWGVVAKVRFFHFRPCKKVIKLISDWCSQVASQIWNLRTEIRILYR